MARHGVFGGIVGVRELPGGTKAGEGGESEGIPVPTFHPEYGRYMLESTPGAPYTGSIAALLSVEANMRYRCARISLLSTP